MNWWLAGYGIASMVSWIIFVWDLLRVANKSDARIETSYYAEIGLQATIGALLWPLAWFFILAVGGSQLLVRQIDRFRVRLRGVKL